MVDAVDTPLIPGGLDTTDAGLIVDEVEPRRSSEASVISYDAPIRITPPPNEAAPVDEVESRRSSEASGNSTTERTSPQIEVTLPVELSTETEAPSNDENDKPDGPNSSRQKLIDTPASWDEVHKYKMDYKKRGYFVIFNLKFLPPGNDSEFEERKGTDKDRNLLIGTAEKLGFEFIEVFEDSTQEKIFAEMKKISEADHSDYDCFVCCILTHGGEDDVLYATDKAFKLKEITKLFRPDNCPSLAGKPKLFFIQACRGTKLDDGHWLVETPFDTVDGPGDNKGIKENSMYKIPLEADFLIAQSTVEDYYAWRSAADGSIFIQSLCECLDHWGRSKEIMQILTRVNHTVAYNFKSNTSKTKMNEKKQMPSINSRLTAELYFGSKVRSEKPSSSRVQVKQLSSDIQPVRATFDQGASLIEIANAVKEMQIDLKDLSSKLDSLKNSKENETQGTPRTTYCVIL